MKLVCEYLRMKLVCEFNGETIVVCVQCLITEEHDRLPKWRGEANTRIG